MRVGILGCGTIGSYVLNAVLAGKVGCASAVAAHRRVGSRYRART